MSFDRLERRLVRALGETATGLPAPAGRLDAVITHGTRRRRWARAGAAMSGLAAASVIAVASAWAVGAGIGPAGPSDGAGSPALTETTLDHEPSVGTAPPTTSPTGESDVAVGTSPPADSSVGTAPPTTSPTGESDVVVGTSPPATSPTGDPGETVGTAPRDDSATTTAPPTTTTTLALPVPLAACPAYGELTDDFGVVGDGNRIHEGIDVIAPKGTPVWAADGGTVTLRTSGPNGNAVYLTAADGNVFVYAHLHDFAVADGAAVGAGDRLGTIGESGLVDRPQLHFEIRPGGGEAIGPYLAVTAACG